MEQREKGTAPAAQRTEKYGNILVRPEKPQAIARAEGKISPEVNWNRRSEEKRDVPMNRFNTEQKTGPFYTRGASLCWVRDRREKKKT